MAKKQQAEHPQTLFIQEANPKITHQDPFTSSWLTNAVLIRPDSKTIFEWPPSSKLEEYMAKGIYLIGFENNEEDGTGVDFNWILSNGTRSTQRDEDLKYYDHMIPADALKKIRSVTIHFGTSCIWGFSFFDKDGALLWKIGDTRSNWKKEIVVLEENEVIVGVVAKL